MNRFLLFTLCLLSSSGAFAAKPKIVLVLVDDLGWADLGCQGSDFYETPHIDSLAKEGVRFTDGYAACAVCSPSRAAVMTGRYPHRTGITNWIRSRAQGAKVPKDRKNPCWKPKEQWQGKGKLICPPNGLWLESTEVTLAEVLKPEGYVSCYIGKWHLGTDDWYPTEQGFDYNVGGCDFGEPPSYFDPYNKPKSFHPITRDGIPGLPGRKPGQYLTDREAEEADAFIRKHKDQPFFLMLANYAVHTPIQSREDLAAKYRAKKKTGIHRNPVYAAMIESVDDAVGVVVNTLEELNLTNNTLIIFTSDNGGVKGLTNNLLRDGKGYPYEGGVRVPFIVKWPGVAKAGSEVSEPVISMDILPTIAAAAGAKLPDVELDGKDLKPLLAGSGEIERDTLYWHYPHYRQDRGPYSTIRHGDWKLVKWFEGGRSLFHLKDDLGEENDLAKSMSEKVEELEGMLMTHLSSTTDLIPIPNPNYKPEAPAER
ncbi:MAG: sulfatase [Verrucomicrobiales bacterium]|nr:sulfatase [Verrucomicrobiales bacterium]